MKITAKFEYEVRKGMLNLYDRIDVEKGEDILRFLAQVPFESDLEVSVKSVVDKTYEGMHTFSRMRILAKDLFSEQTFDYIK